MYAGSYCKSTVISCMQEAATVTIESLVVLLMLDISLRGNVVVTKPFKKDNTMFSATAVFKDKIIYLLLNLLCFEFFPGIKPDRNK